jgi:hypothetical protein
MASSGARYEIAVDGTPRTYRDREELALAAATLLQANLPHSEITVRDRLTGKVTNMKHPSGK